jgi:hypothetical protein
MNMKQYYILFLSVVSLLTSTSIVHAQDKINFGGVGRSLLQNDRLGERDTMHANKSNTGYTLVDQAITVLPNSTTEIQAIVRFRNEYGGFYGNGASVTFRQLYIKGTINDHLKYQFGDINLGGTKYTVYNSNPDASINEAAAFKMLTDINNYENFNFGNTWRQQGARAEWTYDFEKKQLNNITVNGFITRNRQSNFSSLPELLFGGTSVNIKQSQYLSLGGNFVSLFSLAKSLGSVDVVKNYQNRVLTGTFNLSNGDSARTGLYFKGEVGQSNLNIENKQITGIKNDFFYDMSIGTQLKKQHVDLEVGYRDVGPDFFSAAAQTKRITFVGTDGTVTNPGLFPKVTNLDIKRPVTIFDITRDRNIYNQVIMGRLMNTDMSLITLSNVLPYGVATPNRTGFTVKAAYSDSAKILDIGLNISMLKEIRGEGTSFLRNFILVGAKADFYLNKLLNFEKIEKFTIGYQMERTSRNGNDSTALEKITLNSNIFDLGTELEVLKHFDVLLGAKLVTSVGNEFGKQLDDLNQISNFTKIDNINISQTLLAGGFRYRFNENINLSIQAQKFNYDNNARAALSYDFRQIFILFNMKF